MSYGSKRSKKEGGRQRRAQAFLAACPSTIFQSALPSPRYRRSATAELNRLDQACEVLTHTGARAAKDSQAHRAGASGHYFGRARPLPADPGSLGKMVGHQGSAPRTPAWKVLAHGHEACISQDLCPQKWNPVLESHQPPPLCRRMPHCSANGMEIESAGGSAHLRPRCYLLLPFSIRLLLAEKSGSSDCRRNGRNASNTS